MMLRFLRSLFRCDHRDAMKEVNASGVLELVCPCGHRTVAIARSKEDRKKLRTLQKRIAQSKQELIAKPVDNVVPIRKVGA